MRLETTRPASSHRMSQQHGRGASQRSPRRRGKERVGPFAAVRVALMRLGRSKGLLAAIGFGILMAVTLISTVPLYGSLIMNLELQRQIHASDPLAQDIEARFSSSPVSTQVRDASARTVTQLGQRYLSGFSASQSTSYVVSDEVLITSAGSQRFDVASARPPEAKLEAWDYSVASKYMTVQSGHVPAPTAGGSLPQALITSEMSSDLSLKEGDTIVVIPFGNHGVQQKLIVSGVWLPVNPQDPYWSGARFGSAGNENDPHIYPLLVDSTAFYTTLPPFATVGMTQHWVYYSVPEKLNTANMSDAQSRISTFRTHIDGDLRALPGAGQSDTLTSLDTIINGVSKEQTLLSLPLYMIVAQVVGLTLLFVATIAGLLVASQSQEVATLKSRGASSAQILMIYATLGAVVALVAALIGPWLASLIAHQLLISFIPKQTLISTGVPISYFDHLATPLLAAGPAAIGAVLGMATVAVAAWQSARLDVLAFRREQGRTLRAPFYQRYYLDIALVVLCGLGYLELGMFGGSAVRLQLGGSTSPLLLVAPALLLLAGGLLVLRLLPLIASAGARLAAGRRGLTTMLAFSQVERQPGRYARMTMLIVLAAGLGLFALTFNGSLAQSASDRATYAAGTSLRITTRISEGGGADTKIAALLAKQAGVVQVSPVLRGSASTTSDQGDLSVNVLGIEPTTFEQVAGPISWRGDYATSSLHTLMANMAAHRSTAGAGSADAPIYADVSEQFASQFAVHRGDRFTLQLNQASLGTTTFIVGDIVRYFPTLYPQQTPGSFVVMGLSDFRSAILANATGDPSQVGPNEFWVRATPGSAPKLAATIHGNGGFDALSVATLDDALATTSANPISTGIRGLLLLGAGIAALLAIVGTVIQSGISARQRATQFAILRTLGTTTRQITSLLFDEQLIVFALGLLGGAALGIILSLATVPLLVYSDSSVDLAKLGVPPYQILYSPSATGIFFTTLALAFVISLVVASWSAARVMLSQALRVSED
ncbi:MAG TPA: FtsX-like permease family protein [Ktedonobacterales bacterium]